jgi:hypothetical protein
VIATDDFTRSDSAINELGDLWEVEDGEWKISGNELLHVSGDPGTVYCTTLNPFYDQVIRMEWDSSTWDSGTWRILIADDRKGNYIAFEIEPSVATPPPDDFLDFTFRLIQNGTVIKTMTGYHNGYSEQNYIFLVTITAEGHFCASGLGVIGGNGSHIMTACIDPPRGNYAGIQVIGDTGGGNEFNWFRYAIQDTFYPGLFPADVEGNCASCDCSCDGFCYPENLFMTFQSSVSSCGAGCPEADWSSGMTLDEAGNPGSGSRGGCGASGGRWDTDANGPCLNTKVSFWCCDQSLNLAQMFHFGGYCYPTLEESTCDPLYVVFDYHLHPDTGNPRCGKIEDYEDGGSCPVRIIITE